MIFDTIMMKDDKAWAVKCSGDNYDDPSVLLVTTTKRQKGFCLWAKSERQGYFLFPEIIFLISNRYISFYQGYITFFSGKSSQNCISYAEHIRFWVLYLYPKTLKSWQFVLSCDFTTFMTLPFYPPIWKDAGKSTLKNFFNESQNKVRQHFVCSGHLRMANCDPNLFLENCAHYFTWVDIWRKPFAPLFASMII